MNEEYAVVKTTAHGVCEERRFASYKRAMEYRGMLNSRYSTRDVYYGIHIAKRPGKITKFFA